MSESLSMVQSHLEVDAKIRAEKFAMFKKHCHGSELNLSGKQLTGADIHLVCNYLQENPRITSLNVSFNSIGASGAQALAGNRTLVSLNVSCNGIGDVGAQALATNQMLIGLDVSSNGIGNAGAQALATNQTLVSLNVSCNGIGDVGAQALATNQTLIGLDVSGNLICAIGATALVGNQTLTSLIAFGNAIDADLTRVLEQLPKRNRLFQKQSTQKAGEVLEELLPKVLVSLVQNYTPGASLFFKKDEKRSSQLGDPKAIVIEDSFKPATP